MCSPTAAFSSSTPLIVRSMVPKVVLAHPIPSMREVALPQGAEKQRMVRSMFDAIAPRYDLVNRIMTFRLDVRWRKRTVRSLALPSGALVIDLAAGTGD